MKDDESWLEWLWHWGVNALIFAIFVIIAVGYRDKISAAWLKHVVPHLPF